MSTLLKLGSMPPKAAHFCLKVENFLSGELNIGLAGQTLVLGFSGGADSRAVLLALNALRERPALRGCNLLVAHLNHGLRPEAEAEEEDAAALCSALGLEFRPARRDVAALASARNIGLEEAGRMARMEFFSGLLEKNSGGWIVLGHQLNDLAEDVLMRLLRGGGWPALGGMRAADRPRRVLRPLLLTPRRDVEEFLRSLGQSWSEDASNDDRTFLRNRVRHDILPGFLRENPSFLENCANLWRMAALDRDWFDTFEPPFAPVPEGEAENALFLDKTDLAGVSAALRLRWYKKALERLGPGQVLASNLLALDRAWQSGRGGATVQFPGGKSAAVRRGGVAFRPSGADRH